MNRHFHRRTFAFRVPEQEIRSRGNRFAPNDGTAPRFEKNAFRLSITLLLGLALLCGGMLLAAESVLPKRPVPKRAERVQSQSLTKVLSRNVAKNQHDPQNPEPNGDFHVTKSSMIQRVSWESEKEAVSETETETEIDESAVPSPPRTSGSNFSNLDTFLELDPAENPYEAPTEETAVNDFIERLHEKLDRSSEPANDAAPGTPENSGVLENLSTEEVDLELGSTFDDPPESKIALAPGDSSSEANASLVPQLTQEQIQAIYAQRGYLFPGAGQQTAWGQPMQPQMPQQGVYDPYSAAYYQNGYFQTNPYYYNNNVYANPYAATPGAYWGAGGFSQHAPGTPPKRFVEENEEEKSQSWSPLSDTFQETFSYFNPLKTPQGPDRGVGGPLKMRSWRDRPYYVGIFGGAMDGSMLIDRLVDQKCGATGGLYFGWYCDDYWGVEARLHFASLPARETAYGKRMYEAWYTENYGETSYIPPMNRASHSLTMFDVSVHYYPLGNAKWRPFLKFGLGAVSQRYKGFYGVSGSNDAFSIPWGVGVKYWWNERIALHIDLVDNLILSSDNFETQNNFALTFGLDFPIGKNRRAKPKVVYWPWQGSATW